MHTEEFNRREKAFPRYRQARRWEAEFDFEVADGVRKLRRLRLIDDTEGGLSAVSLEEAARRLDETWDDLFAYNTRGATATHART